jgi:hypothetical protein
MPILKISQLPVLSARHYRSCLTTANIFDLLAFCEVVLIGSAAPWPTSAEGTRHQAIDVLSSV